MLATMSIWLPYRPEGPAESCGLGLTYDCHLGGGRQRFLDSWALDTIADEWLARSQRNSAKRMEMQMRKYSMVRFIGVRPRHDTAHEMRALLASRAPRNRGVPALGLAVVT